MVASPVLQRLHLGTRLLLAMAFLPTGMVKVLGLRFTLLEVEHPVGFFFEAMYSSGWYWNLIGWGQVVAALLLLVPRTAFLGAVLFLPIIVNVWAITLSVGFQGTGVVTTLMLGANLFLLAWEGDRLGGILKPLVDSRSSVPGMPQAERAGWWMGAGAGFLLVFATRFPVPSWALPIAFVGAGAGALLVLGSWLGRRARVPPRTG